MGLNQLHLAFLIGMNLVIGLTTPPVGLSLYVSSNIGKVNLAQASKAVLPFVAVQIVVLFIISYVPSIPLWLPRVVGLVSP